MPRPRKFPGEAVRKIGILLPEDTYTHLVELSAPFRGDLSLTIKTLIDKGKIEVVQSAIPSQSPALRVPLIDKYTGKVIKYVDKYRSR